MVINTDFDKNKKHLEEKDEMDSSFRRKPIHYLIICIVLILFIIGFAIYRNYRSDYNYLKEDRSEMIVYTNYNQNNKEVPYINIKSSSVKSVNQNIQEFCNQYINDDNATIKYEYYISCNYLTLLVKILDIDTNLSYLYFLQPYTINLKTRTYMNEEELLKYFNVTEEDVSSRINKQLLDYYNEEVSEGIIPTSECDFECYLSTRDITNYLDDVTYGIKNGKLIAFRPFVFTSIYGEEDYFTEEHFEFEITD